MSRVYVKKEKRKRKVLGVSFTPFVVEGSPTKKTKTIVARGISRGLGRRKCIWAPTTTKYRGQHKEGRQSSFGYYSLLEYQLLCSSGEWYGVEIEEICI